MADAVDSCDNSASDANTILSGMKKWNNLHQKPKVPFLNTYEKQVTRHRKLFKFSVKKDDFLQDCRSLDCTESKLPNFFPNYIRSLLNIEFQIK